jgi:predicted ester cyclase
MIVTAARRTPFPTRSFTIDDMIAEGDEVVTKKTFRGDAQSGLLRDPTGRQ